MKKSVLLSVLTASVLSGAVFAEEMNKNVAPAPEATSVAAPAATSPAAASTAAGGG